LTKISIIGQNSFFWPKFVRDLNFDFWPNCKYLTKISIIGQNFDFWPNKIFDQNFDFWSKFKSLTKISIFGQNLNLWPKFRFLPEFQSLAKMYFFVDNISVCDQNLYFWFILFDTKFIFWPKFQLLTKIQGLIIYQKKYLISPPPRSGQFYRTILQYGHR